MLNKFRQTHLFAFLDHFDRQSAPLDLAFSNYLRAHKSIGAHDRRILGDLIYALFRWKSLFDYLIDLERSSPLEGALAWRERLDLWHTIDLSKLPSHLPAWAKCGATPWLFQQLSADYGEPKAFHLCMLLNEPAPLTVRVNLLKTTRETLLSRWTKIWEVETCSRSNAGIRFRKRTALTALPEFKEGLFEIQDEGSQLVADLVRAKPGDQVLDYCSGSGGKSLAFAPRLLGKGQIYLHDIRLTALQEAKKRLRRNGIQNAQFLAPDHPRLASLKGQVDWVLADVPCSGSGTYRRNPDMKRKMDESTLNRLVAEQQEIFQRALSFVRPGGHIVYATCSLFSKENNQQVDYFLRTLPVTLTEPPLALFPESNSHDGFFAASFQKT